MVGLPVDETIYGGGIYIFIKFYIKCSIKLLLLELFSKKINNVINK